MTDQKPPQNGRKRGLSRRTVLKTGVSGSAILYTLPVPAASQSTQQSTGYGTAGYGEGPYGGDTTSGGIVDQYDTDDNGLETTELLDGIKDWRAGSLQTTDLLKLINAWRANN